MEKKYLFSSFSDLTSKMSRAAGQVWQGVIEDVKSSRSGLAGSFRTQQVHKLTLLVCRC